MIRKWTLEFNFYVFIISVLLIDKLFFSFYCGSKSTHLRNFNMSFADISFFPYVIYNIFFLLISRSYNESRWVFKVWRNLSVFFLDNIPSHTTSLYFLLLGFVYFYSFPRLQSISKNITPTTKLAVSSKIFQRQTFKDSNEEEEEDKDKDEEEQKRKDKEEEEDYHRKS